MLFLLFHVKSESYVIDAREVVEVVPRVGLRSIPKAPDYIAGLLNYRGAAVPVIDLCVLLSEQPCKAVFGSRIMLVNYGKQHEKSHILGLVAERVTETLQRDIHEFHPSTINSESAPYLSEVITHRDYLVQRIEIEHLLPASVHGMLFP